MYFFRKSIVTFVLIALSLSACGKVTATQVATTEPEVIVPALQTEAILSTQTSPAEPASLSTSATDTSGYTECGPAGLVDVGYYFKDNNGDISPTQFVRIRKTDDEVRDYVSVITCLKNDEGWISNPNEVENGYENEIIFFDKSGKAHTYRIIIGGHYVEPYDPTHKDITASLNGVDDFFYYVQEWIDATRDHFLSNGSRQIGVDIYLNDNQGDLSKVLTQVYKFRETNLQILQGLQTGEGYPDQVPDGFFLFATYSWLIQPD
jgi:hypothetical protein